MRIATYRNGKGKMASVHVTDALVTLDRPCGIGALAKFCNGFRVTLVADDESGVYAVSEGVNVFAVVDHAFRILDYTGTLTRDMPAAS